MTTGGDDFVSARINFEMPPEATAQMRELNTELDRFRTNTEAAARGVDSFMRYIHLLNDAQERASQSSRNLASNLERVLQLQERSAGGQGTAVPQMYSTPWGGTNEGMGGSHRDVAPIPTTVPTGGNQTMFDHLAANDPRAYLNARAAWGGGAHPQDQLPPVSISEASLDRLAAAIAQRDQQQQVQEAKQPPSPGPPATGRGGGGGGGRSGGGGGQAPWESWRDRATQWAGTAGNVAGALGMGGSVSGVLGRVGHALQGWGRRQQDDPAVPAGPGGSAPAVQPVSGGGEEPSVPTGGQTEESIPGAPEGGGGGLAGLGKAAGAAGAGITAGLGVWKAIQGIGHEVQQYRALGQIRGGGFGEGFGYEMQARTMALNPFIKTEQARQIIQSALTQGYTGKEFDTVTEFMAHNLTEMNMSASDSMKLLNDAAQNSNKSIQGVAENLNTSLGVMKDLSKTGYNSLPQRQQAYEQVYGGALQSGARPDVASDEALVAGQMFAHEPGMAGMGAELLTAARDNPGFGVLMMRYGGIGNIPGLDMSDPGSIGEALQNTGQFPAAMWRTLQFLARKSPNVGVFQSFLKNALGVNVSRAKARRLYQHALAVGTGTSEDPLKDIQEAKEGQKRAADQELTRKGEIATSGPRSIGGALGGGPRLPPGAAKRYAEQHDFSGENEGSQIEDRILQNFEGEAFEVGSGDKWSNFDPSSTNMIGDLKKGKIHIREKGDTGPGINLKDIPGAQGGGDGKNGVQGQLNITVHPANMRSALGVPQYVPLTANEQRANAGEGNATKNNPDSGDTITSRGYR